MKTLFLADLAGMDREKLLAHIKESYEPEEFDFRGCVFLVAYESVGSYGCDSSSFFLFRRDEKLYEVHGSHCSCYGFEDQWKPGETSVVALKHRAKEGRVFSAGGYDDNETENQRIVTEFVKKLRG
jgi:hypothetical protein